MGQYVKIIHLLRLCMSIENKDQYPKEIQGRAIACSIIPNLNNDKDYLIVTPKDFIKDWSFEDYCHHGFVPLKRN